MRFHPNDWFIAKNILFRRLFDKLRIRIQRINDWKRVYRSCINMSKLHGVVNLLCTTWKRERMGQPDLIVLGQPTVILRKLQRWLDAAKLSGHRGAGPGRAGVAVPVDKFWVPAGLAQLPGFCIFFARWIVLSGAGTTGAFAGAGLISGCSSETILCSAGGCKIAILPLGISIAASKRCYTSSDSTAMILALRCLTWRRRSLLESTSTCSVYAVRSIPARSRFPAERHPGRSSSPRGASAEF